MSNSNKFDQRKKLYENYVSELKHKGLHSLSAEIDRCLKKVSEGVETFEDIWQKVHNATNTNQKEKYETDLKKEIKKLQRLRDQIKSWIASGEIKDKSTLVDTRKLIETQMERFKVVERETKTKAYSKEGLGAQQKLDPTTREREDLNNWLAISIDQMQLQMDQFESEIESIMAGKKKKLDKEKQDRLDELKIFMEKHKFHMSKLETLMRMLDNLSIDVNATGLREFLSQVKKIKDDIEYYLESSQEAEFEENEFLYDDIEGLEEQQALGNLALIGNDEVETPPTSITSGNNSPILSSPIHSSSDSCDQRIRKSSDDSLNKVIRPVAIKPPPPPNMTSPIKTPIENNSSPSSGGGGAQSNHVSSQFSSLSSSPIQNVLNNIKSLSLEEQNSNPTNIDNKNYQTYDSIMNGVHENFEQRLHEKCKENGFDTQQDITTADDDESESLVNNHVDILTETINGPHLIISPINHHSNNISHNFEQSNSQTPPPPPQQQHTTVMDFIRMPTTEHLLLGRYLETGDNTNTSTSISTITLKSIAQDVIDRAGLSIIDHGLERTIEAIIPPLLGVAPLGPVPLQKEHHYQIQMLEAAHHHLPVSADSERMRQFLPRNPYPSPTYYPQIPLTNSDTIEFFQRLSIETLFFIFYYLEGTKAQYLAAKVLKKQSWRFHTKYMMWFQRHEEPKVINEDYEQGTYIYFDIEKWGQRKKDGFVFEYRYLEDRELS